MSEESLFADSLVDRSGEEAEDVGPGIPSLQSLGAILRDRRESAGIPLSDVEAATRIRQKYLAAMEADEWHLLPGEVVGRGFLRNYAYYLNLDPNRMTDRRRAMVDSSLSRTLAGTSSGVRLPPERPVDYRPKDVDLEHTAFSTRLSESLGSIRDWLAPVLVAVLIVLVGLLLFWGARQMSGQLGVLISTVQERFRATVTAGQGGAAVTDGTADDMGGETGAAPAPTVASPLPTETATSTPAPPPQATDTPQPTDTPEALPSPTETAEPSPTATEEPPEEEPPQAVPPPAPPPVVPVACPDGRLAISSPGVNQTVRGVVQITGRAVHAQFDSYKLEWAPGANATQRFTWFDGSDHTGSGGSKGPAVENGLLGSLDSASLPNGAYTLSLTVVDTSGNYPAPCRVTIIVQN